MEHQTEEGDPLYITQIGVIKNIKRKKGARCMVYGA